DDGRQVDADFTGLLGHREAEILVGDDDRRFVFISVRNALQRLLEEGLLIDNLDELLWRARARQWPEPRAFAASHDYGDDLIRHNSLSGGRRLVVVWAQPWIGKPVTTYYSGLMWKSGDDGSGKRMETRQPAVGAGTINYGGALCRHLWD